MHWIDWSILAGFAVFIILIALGTRKYTRSVADFLAASRCGGRYILSMCDGMAAFGVVSAVAMFQAYYEGGFTVFWWQCLTMPATLLVGILGWVIYRFRQTRAFTFGQFFEIRYSRNFRFFAGLLAFISGIINFGIFPSVGAHFFVYFCDLPQTLPILGMELSTYGMVMAILILTAVGFTFIGGQIAVMVTDFIQAAFCNAMFILVLVLLYIHFNWNEIADSIAAAPPGKSMVNPYDIGDLKNYNTFYWLIGLFAAFYTAYAWQGQQAYNCSATNAHEAKMSKVLGYFRWLTLILFLLMLPICAYTMMHHGNYADKAAVANSALSTIDSEQIRSQMTVPLAMKQVLPVGVMGAFCAVMFAAFISTHDTYLHSWGSIFIQDVILPLRKKPLTPRQHLWCLRLAILGVAVFIFCFSFFYSQKSDILMFFALSGTIFLGGAGAVIIGGLYWKRGTTGGAWAAMATGLTMAVIGFALDQYWTDIAKYLQGNWPDDWQHTTDMIPALNSEKFIFTPQEMFFFAMIASILAYVLVSLLGRQSVFDLDRMLHRGKYAIDKDPSSPEESVAKRGIKSIIGFDRHFTLADKITYVVSYATLLTCFGGVIVGTICQLKFHMSDSFWLSFWHGFVAVFGVITVALILWLTIGGFVDLKKLFVLLKQVKRNDADDGTVVDHHNLDETQ